MHHSLFRCLWRAFLLGTASFFSLLLCVLMVALGTYLFILSQFDGNASLPADCAVVFGAAVSGYNRPGPAIERRVSKAVDLYRRGEIHRLIMSGGVGKGSGKSLSEAEVMRSEALRYGVNADAIVTESASRSTWENLLFSRPLTEGCSSVVGISDQFHLARIQFLAWRQGWGNLKTVPAEVRPPEGTERKSIFREILATMYYVSYLDVLFPDIQRTQ